MKDANVPAEELVIREVRDARAKLWKEGGGTIAGFIEAAKRRADAHVKRRPRKAGRRA